jgi:CelD/BcsL family acetyltransferase involved in cellulose biosynthesis
MTARILHDSVDNPCWLTLIEAHPAATIFHTPGWLNALRKTYGYESFVITTSPGSTLDNGLVACHVKGWTSGRVVSLPFSDHCDPLVKDAAQFSEGLGFLLEHARRGGARSVEMRPTPAFAGAFGEPVGNLLQPARRYCFHQVDLRQSEAELFARLHHSNARRAIRRAEREGLTYEAGTTEPMLASFYRLLRMTRRRHGLPPQPISWFRNLLANLDDRASIHLASKDGEPVAGMLCLSFKSTTYYKYGGSNAAQHRLGGMPFLFWRMMLDARRRGSTRLDLGRSDIDQPGLITFKDHLGAERSTLQYYRHPRQPESTRSRWIERAARGTFSHLPDVALDLAGKLIYKRLG